MSTNLFLVGGPLLPASPLAARTGAVTADVMGAATVGPLLAAPPGAGNPGTANCGFVAPAVPIADTDDDDDDDDDDEVRRPTGPEEDSVA